MTLWMTIACLFALLPSFASAQDEMALPYADSTWPTLHAGPRNDDYVPIEVATKFQQKWTALDGSSIITAPVVGPEGHIYATTGHGPGSSNLHAFDGDGNSLWASEPWQDAGGLDYCAVMSSPIVDDAGHVYVSDCNQLWSFQSDGTRRWVIDLPPPPETSPWFGKTKSPINSFVTARQASELHPAVSARVCAGGSLRALCLLV